MYVAEVPGAVIVSDRATWAASAAGRLSDHDPLLACALLNTGFPLGSVTPFAGVSALPPSTTLHALSGTLTTIGDSASSHASPAGRAADVAAALVAAVAPLREAGQPVELSLTGGKDSRLVAAALVAAGVPVLAKTHGFDGHPDVVIAAEIAKRLGIEHTVTTPAAPGQQTDVLGRLRATVLVADGMLSAFENVGRPDPVPSTAVTAGGHGGELLRGGYAETAAGRRAAPLRAARAAAPPDHAARGPAPPRRGGGLRRQPRAVERRARTRAVAGPRRLLPGEPGGPLVGRRPAGLPAAGEPGAAAVRRAGGPRGARRPARGPGQRRAVAAGARGAVPGPGGRPAGGQGGRRNGGRVVRLAPPVRRRDRVVPADYVLDLGTSGGLFDVVSRSAAEKVLTPPHADGASVWALATLACLLSGDYRNAREPAPLLSVT